jgi:hypothetical protein
VTLTLGTDAAARQDTLGNNVKAHLVCVTRTSGARTLSVRILELS